MPTTSLSDHDVSPQAAERAGFQATLSGMCVAPLREIGWIRVTGDDRVRWLNGMVTNSIQALTPGEGCFNFLLNAQGRIQGTATAFAEADAILLRTDRAQVEPILAMLDRYIIMDDVELATVSEATSGLLIVGPAAAQLLTAQSLLPEALATAGLRSATITWQGASLRVQAMGGRVVPRFEIWAATDVLERLHLALLAEGGIEGDATTLEWLRLLEGTPKFGADIRDRELAQETGQTEALHFSKGCYLGQEIVERIRSRGAVHRTFAGFALAGGTPAVGAALSAGGKPVGEITSVGIVPEVPGYLAGGLLALGYIRREALDSKQDIHYEGGLAQQRSLPATIGTGNETHPMEAIREESLRRQYAGRK